MRSSSRDASLRSHRQPQWLQARPRFDRSRAMSRAALRRYFRHGLFPQLLVFEAVARLGSVTRAAEELHLPQPTVSLQLKKLAPTLELALFAQQGRRLLLTPAGAALTQCCLALFSLFAR